MSTESWITNAFTSFPAEASEAAQKRPMSPSW